MGKISLGERLNTNSKQGIIFTEEYRKVRLDPRTLIPSEQNKYSQDNIEELADNMLLVGQLQEVIVGRVNGQDRIIVGHRRTAAAVLNIQRGYDEFKLIDCKVKEMPEAVFMLTLHSANIFNRRLSDWELTEGVAEFKKYLIAAKEAGEVTIEGKMRDYIAKAIGESTGKVNQINSINNNLCEEGKEAFKNGDMNFTTAYETSRLPKDKQKEVIEQGGLLSGEVKEMVAAEREKKEPTKAAVEKFYEAHAKRYDTDRTKLKEMLIDKLGRSHNGGNSGGVNYQCSIRGVKLESAEEITWARFVQMVNELYPVEQEDFDPKPDTVTALCYSCVHYEECHEKKSTVTSCDSYVDRKEAYKTEEQIYDEEQAAIDKETRKKLREQEDAAAVNKGQTAAEPKERDIRISKEKYKAITAGDLSFLLLKKDGYGIGEKIEVAEYKDGEPTGSIIAIGITYIWEDWNGLEEDYCIIGFRICEITEKDTGIPGQMTIEEM